MPDQQNWDAVVVGGGAAGYMAAITAARQAPGARVAILERGPRTLDKVRISGGGRCNVTHASPSHQHLLAHYPRGLKLLKRAFRHWWVPDVLAWFRAEGVALKTEADGRMFPVSDDSATIVNALAQAAERAGVVVHTRTPVVQLQADPGGRWRVHTQAGQSLAAQAVVVATGGSPTERGLEWLRALGLPTQPVVPSLFTLNLPDSPFAGLEGVAVDGAEVRLPGTKLARQGPVLVTHWGLSGPAVLALSALGARHFAQHAYQLEVRLALAPTLKPAEWQTWVAQQRTHHPNKLVANTPTAQLPKRLWARLLELADLPAATPWAQAPAKPLNRLLELLTNLPLAVQGKTTYKEEFVTAGGVDVAALDPDTMQANALPGLYLAGEVLDMDGLTGGFNFQAAWTTGWLAGRAVGQQLAAGANGAA